MQKMTAKTPAHQTMPLYQCHKRVRAFKIADIHHFSGQPLEVRLSPEPASEGPAIEPVIVGPAFMDRHKPEVGGYFVVYEDGYVSYSPAKAFEEGYTLVTEEAPEEATEDATEEAPEDATDLPMPSEARHEDEDPRDPEDREEQRA